MPEGQTYAARAARGWVRSANPLVTVIGSTRVVDGAWPRVAVLLSELRATIWYKRYTSLRFRDRRSGEEREGRETSGDCKLDF
jgi:hypothetical protein